jgi:hypothetical protein
MRCRKLAASMSRVAVTEMGFVLHASTCLISFLPGPCRPAPAWPLSPAPFVEHFRLRPHYHPCSAPETSTLAARALVLTFSWLPEKAGIFLSPFHPTPLHLPSRSSLAWSGKLGESLINLSPATQSETLDPPTRLSRPLAQSLVSARSGGPRQFSRSFSTRIAIITALGFPVRQVPRPDMHF